MAEAIVKRPKQWHEGDAIEIIADQIGVTTSQIRKALKRERIAWRYNLNIFLEPAGETEEGDALLSVRTFEDFKDFKEALRLPSKQHALQLAAYTVKAILEEFYYSQQEFFVLAGGTLFDGMVEWLKKQNALEKGYSYFFLYGAYLWHTPESVRAHRKEIIAQDYSSNPYDWPFLPKGAKDKHNMELARDFDFRHWNKEGRFNVKN